jgi:hypothetical protein
MNPGFFLFDYPLFRHYLEKKRFEVQLGELWTVDCGLSTI